MGTERKLSDTPGGRASAEINVASSSGPWWGPAQPAPLLQAMTSAMHSHPLSSGSLNIAGLLGPSALAKVPGQPGSSKPQHEPLLQAWKGASGPLCPYCSPCAGDAGPGNVPSCPTPHHLAATILVPAQTSAGAHAQADLSPGLVHPLSCVCPTLLRHARLPCLAPISPHLPLGLCSFPWTWW